MAQSIPAEQGKPHFRVSSFPSVGPKQLGALRNTPRMYSLLSIISTHSIKSTVWIFSQISLL